MSKEEVEQCVQLLESAAAMQDDNFELVRASGSNRSASCIAGGKRLPTIVDLFVWIYSDLRILKAQTNMGQIKGLWRDTWWQWLLFIGATIAMALTVTIAYLLGLLILPAIFLYFAFGRYDKNGNQVER